MSKNNFNERLRKMAPKKDHYSIRKFSVGVASVLVGFSFLGLANSQLVKADTTAQPQTVQASKTVSGEQKQVAQNDQKQLEQGNVPANNSQTKQTLTAIQAAAVKAMQEQQASVIARKNSRLPEEDKPAQKIAANLGLSGRKDVQGPATGIQNKVASSAAQDLNDQSEKTPAAVVNKSEDAGQTKAAAPAITVKQVNNQKSLANDNDQTEGQNLHEQLPVAQEKKTSGYQTINFEDLTAADQNALAKSLGVSLRELKTEVANNASGIVIPASEWLGTASWDYQTLNMQTGVLKANTDTSLPFKIISKIKGGNVAHNEDYELRIRLDHRLDPYVKGIKVSQQGDVNDDNASQKSMTKNADDSWSLPLFAVHGGVMGLANVDIPYTNPHCEILFNDQIDNFYKNLGDLKNNPLQYAIYGYDKKTGKVIGDYKNTGYIISQDGLFDKSVATGDDAERPFSAHQPYYQGADLILQYDQNSNTINALYNPVMLGDWSWDDLAKSKINSLNYQVDSRLVPYINGVKLINYKTEPDVFPFNDNGTPKSMKITGTTPLTLGKADTTYVGQGKVQVNGSLIGGNMSISGLPRQNHYVGIAYHLNDSLGNIINKLALEEKANSRLMFGVYFTAKNGKIAPNTLATSAFDIDKLGQADAYQPNYTPVTVTVGDEITSDVSKKSWEDKVPTDNPTYTVQDDPQFTFQVDQTTGNIKVTPINNQTKVGMHNMVVTVKYSDDTTDVVNVPVYVQDVNHHITWGKDPKNKSTGAVVVVTDPSRLGAHETSDNSQVLNPSDAVIEIDQYKIAKNGKAVADGTVDKKATKITWTGEVPSTKVDVATMVGQSFNGKINVDLSNVSGIDAVLGNKKSLSTSVKITPMGAIANGTSISVAQNGAQPTSDQLKQLINHKNLDGLPKSMKVDHYALAQPLDASATGTKDVTVRIFFKDKGSDGQETYLDVKVPAGVDVVSTLTDKDQYDVRYQHKTAYQGDPVDFSAPGIVKNDGQPAPNTVIATYGRASDTPSWVTEINSSVGKIHIDKAPAVGYYSIPVKVTYKDNSSEITYAYLAVIDKGTHVIWNGNSATALYRSSVNNYHKTNDGSAHDAEITKDVPTINEIAWTNFETKNHQPETIVYVRQDDGSYKLISGNGFKDANGDIAPVTIAAGQITSVWKAGFEGNSDVSNFPKTGTSTSLAKDQLNNANGEQQQTTGKMAGDSKALILGHFGADAEEIFNAEDSDNFWFNVYSNYFGAKATGAVQTFKQGQDISNLSQTQYRQLVDVTDLGQNGWNGVNINPDAPQVLAYVPGTNSNKTFYMTWAPGKEASTAKVANGIAGTVRIHFGDGTWLDIAVKINIKADQDSGKPDHDKSEFTQKIIYTDNGQEVAYTTIDNIAKGSNLSAETLKNAIDSNVPANYTIQTGYKYPAAITDIQATPAIIYVPLTHNKDDSFNANGRIVYRTAEDSAPVAYGKKISSHIGDILTAGLLKDLADQGMNQPDLKGYVIAQYPASYDVTAKDFTITVIVKAGTKVINPTNPKDPEQNDLFKDVTRKINVHNPDGTVKVTNQVVHFDRTKTINAVTNEVISYGDWQLVAGSAKDWPEFTAPTIADYTADPSSVAEKKVSADSKNETIDIYYHKTNNGGGNNQPTQPTQPNPNPNPQPTNPTPEPNPQPQPTAPNNGGQTSNPAPKPNQQPTNANNNGQKSNPSSSNNRPKATQAGDRQTGRGQGNCNKQASTGRGSNIGAKNENGLNKNNGLGQPAINKGQNTNSSEAAQNNGQGKQVKRLPQTGADQNKAGIFSVIGIALANLAGLFTFGGDRKRNK